MRVTRRTPSNGGGVVAGLGIWGPSLGALRLSLLRLAVLLRVVLWLPSGVTSCGGPGGVMLAVGPGCAD